MERSVQAMYGPPRPGEVQVLIHGCCEGCGWWCAMGEGAVWPKCPGCGEQVWPDGRSPESVPDVDARFKRRADGTGYIALRVPEIAAFELVNGLCARLNSGLGIDAWARAPHEAAETNRLGNRLAAALRSRSGRKRALRD